MANQEHLDLFRQGVEQWNAWRGQLEYYTTMVPDPFGDDDSSAIPMSGSRLRAADLRGKRSDYLVKFGTALLEGAA